MYNEIQNVSGGWVANALGAAAGAYGAGYGYLAGGGKDPNRFLGAVALGGAYWRSKSCERYSFCRKDSSCLIRR